MMSWCEFWADESGVIISSELAILGTVGVVGLTVGTSVMATSVNEEFRDLAFAIRSLDQSYSIRGHRSCSGWTAGSSYVQRPVQESLDSLCAIAPATDQPAPTTPVVPLNPAAADPAGPQPIPEATPEISPEAKSDPAPELQPQPSEA